jgi:hypothetical protein
MKNEVVTSELGRIISASHSATGSQHDLTLQRRGPPLPHGARGYANSSYQSLSGHRSGSYQKDHPDLDIPYKTSKHHQLTEEEKEYNSALSSIRVRAEHAIRRIKIFCICLKNSATRVIHIKQNSLSWPGSPTLSPDFNPSYATGGLPSRLVMLLLQQVYLLNYLDCPFFLILG